VHEQASQRRARIEHGEEVLRDAPVADQLVPVGRLVGEAERLRGRHRRERRRARAPVGEVAGCHVVALDAGLAVVLVQRDDALDVRERQPLEQDAIDRAEDRGVGADADAEREHRGDGERRRLAQRARRVAEVLEQRLDVRAALGVADALLHLLHAPRLDERGAPRVLGGHARPHLLLDEQLDEPPQLAVELPIVPVAPEHRRATTS